MNFKKISELGKNHVVDTTALLTSTNPIYSAIEVGISGMSDKVSIDSRETVAWLSYLGMGFAFSKGRDLSRKIFKITDTTNERIQATHDIIYTAGFNLIVAPMIYLSMGAEPKQAVIGGLSAATASILMGPIMGYSIDVARDLTGIQKCERTSYPKAIRRLASTSKKGLAGLLVAGSIATMAGIYALTPDREEEITQPNQLEELVDKNSNTLIN